MNWNGLPLVVFGRGGMSKETYCLIKDINRANNQQMFDFLGFVSDSEQEIGDKVIDDYEIITFDLGILELARKYPILGMVIPMGTPQVKSKIYDKVRTIVNGVYPNIIHPSVKFDKENVILGIGNVITAGTVLTCDIKLGSFNLINRNTTCLLYTSDAADE